MSEKDEDTICRSMPHLSTTDYDSHTTVTIYPINPDVHSSTDAVTFGYPNRTVAAGRSCLLSPACGECPTCQVLKKVREGLDDICLKLDQASSQYAEPDNRISERQELERVKEELDDIILNLNQASSQYGEPDNRSSEPQNEPTQQVVRVKTKEDMLVRRIWCPCGRGYEICCKETVATTN